MATGCLLDCMCEVRASLVVMLVGVSTGACVGWRYLFLIWMTYKIKVDSRPTY